MHTIAAVHGSKASAHELMPFSWDENIPVKELKPLTEEETNRIFKRYHLN